MKFVDADDIIAGILADAASHGMAGRQIEAYRLSRADYDRVHDVLCGRANVMHGKPAYEATHFLLRTAVGTVRVSPAASVPLGECQVVIKLQRVKPSCEFRVTPTLEVGFHTGRRRYKVECVTCEVMLHEATTGPSERIEQHMRELERARNASTDPTPGDIPAGGPG